MEYNPRSRSEREEWGWEGYYMDPHYRSLGLDPSGPSELSAQEIGSRTYHTLDPSALDQVGPQALTPPARQVVCVTAEGALGYPLQGVKGAHESHLVHLGCSYVVMVEIYKALVSTCRG